MLSVCLPCEWIDVVTYGCGGLPCVQYDTAVQTYECVDTQLDMLTPRQMDGSGCRNSMLVVMVSVP